MVDRYTRVVLTVIAACLVYLCLVFSHVGTPVSAQQVPAPPVGAQRPGMATGPAEVVVVGFRIDPEEPPLPVNVRNTVTTQTAPDSAERVIVAGWEDRRTNTLVRLAADAGLPMDIGSRPSRVVLVGTDAIPGATWRQRVPVETPKEARR